MVKKAKPKKSHLGESKLVIGVDISPTSISLAAKVQDVNLGKIKGPVWLRHAWTKEADHLTKLGHLAKAHEFIYIVMHELNATVELPDTYIGVEDLPARVMQAQRYREHAELLGAFLGGLKRWGYIHVHLVNIMSWQALVAADLSIDFSPKGKDKFNKWTVRNWARELHPQIPRWPDLIRTNKGLIPKPKGSKAMPEQPDDRYDATGIMEFTWELSSKKKKKPIPF